MRYKFLPFHHLDKVMNTWKHGRNSWISSHLPDRIFHFHCSTDRILGIYIYSIYLFRIAASFLILFCLQEKNILTFILQQWSNCWRVVTQPLDFVTSNLACWLVRWFQHVPNHWVWQIRASNMCQQFLLGFRGWKKQASHKYNQQTVFDGFDRRYSPK